MSLNYSRPTPKFTKGTRGSLPSGSLNNKGTDQLAHPRSLISAFAIHTLNSIVFKLAPSETSLFLSIVSVAEKAGFWYDLIGNPEDRFCCIDAHKKVCIYIHENADPIRKPVSCDMHIENV